MKDGVYVKCGKKLYRVNKDAKCTKRTCSMFKPGVCDNDWSNELPCARLDWILSATGLHQYGGVNFKEAAK